MPLHVGATLPADSEQTGPRSEDKIVRGTPVGRYVVVSRLGIGGMGVVYAAYDPELDRKVALKLLLPQARFGSTRDRAQMRLLREAQALARLSHPNVVAVHDVGTVGERVWVAIELVRGQTLGQWLQAAPRSWRDVLHVMVRAGRGLAAAHAACLLHRDFKPDNIMVDDDGRVRVMDFGLARDPDSDSGSATEDDSDTQARPGLATLAMRVTRAGAVIGTPAYMAPDQLMGVQAGAKSDQFSYCVTLYEALYGRPPYGGGRTVGELAAAIILGKIEPPPRRPSVPSWLRQVCIRGLSADPEQRFASIDTLLLALSRGEVNARRRVICGSVALVALGAASVWAAHEVDQARAEAACVEAGDAIDEVWNDETRHSVAAALRDTKVKYAQATADNVASGLDDYTAKWRKHHTVACRLAELDQTWGPDTYEKSQWCFQVHRMQLEALVSELGHADAQVVQRAVVAAAQLQPPGVCADETVARNAVVPSPSTRDSVVAMQRALARARVAEWAGRYTDAVQLARQSRQDAEAVGWPPVAAEAALLEAVALSGAGSQAEAEAACKDAYFDAAAASAWPVAAHAAAYLVHIVGFEQARYAEGRTWARTAEMAEGFTSDPLRLLAASRLDSLANIDYAQGEYSQAQARHEQALDIRRAALSPSHPAVASSLNNLARSRASMGAHDEARVLHEQALEIFTEALGPNHPTVALSLGSLAVVYSAMGRSREAQALYEQALRLFKDALGPDHPRVADTLNNLATVHYTMGRYTEAAVLFKQALQLHKKALAPGHPRVADSLTNLANTHYALGEYSEAKALHEQALDIRREALGPDHPHVAESLRSLAEARHALSEHNEAVVLHERGVD